MEFSLNRISDLCNSSCSGGTPKSTQPAYYEGGTIPWLTTSEVNFNDIYDTDNKITQLGLENSSAKFIPVNSVIVAMYGVTAGRSAINKIPLTTNQACCNLQINEEKANYRYVYYYLMMQSDQLNKLANGGAQQNLNSITIKRFKILIPNLENQNKIAKVLNNYDQLIENNNKRIQLLELMSEQLYKEWFVRFRFPGYEHVEFENKIPNGWELKELKDFGITLISGSRPKGGIDDSLKEGIPSFGAEVIGKLGQFDFSSVKYIPNEFYNKMKRGKNTNYDILIYKDGAYIGKTTTFRDGYPFEKYCINEHVFFIEPNDADYKNYLYLTLHQKEMFDLMQVLNRNAAQPGLSQDDIARIKIKIPSKNIIEKFNEIVDGMLGLVFKYAKENRILSIQRDLLLPRLMSGKLSVEGKEVI